MIESVVKPREVCLLTSAFFKERIDYYDSMLEAYQDPVPSRDLRHYEASKEFVRNRGEFVRKSLQHRFARSRFSLGDVYRVSFEGLGPQVGYMIDGYAEAGAYTGKYFKGQRIEISVPGGSERQRWVVNGETIEGKILSLPVRSDLFISHVKT